MSNKQTSNKSKLFKLKEWLTIPETAKHLSVMLEEDVAEADVLRLGLDRHLKISVNFVNKAHAKRGGKFLPLEEWKEKLTKKASWQNAKALAATAAVDGMIAICFPEFDMSYYLKDEELTKDIKRWQIGYDEELKKAILNKLTPEAQSELLSTMIEQAIISHKKQSEKFGGKVPPSATDFKGKVLTIDGVWDLPMLGNERLDIEHQYQMLTNGPEITLTGLDGAFVEREDGVVVYQLQEEFDKEYLEYKDSEESKLKSLNFYRQFLKKKIVANEIDEKEAEELLVQREKNINIPTSYDDRFYPAGGLPNDCILVVRTQAIHDFLNNLTSGNSEGKNLQETPLFNSRHRFHAKELKIAVEAWTELYQKNPPQHVPSGGHKKYITKWIEKKHPELGQRAKDRIATIINPNPKGGASPTS